MMLYTAVSENSSYQKVEGSKRPILTISNVSDPVIFLRIRIQGVGRNDDFDFKFLQKQVRSDDKIETKEDVINT